MYQSLLLFTKPKHGCTNLSSFKTRREYQFSLVLELYPHCWCLLCVVGSHVDMTCTSRLKNMLGGGGGKPDALATSSNQCKEKCTEFKVLP